MTPYDEQKKDFISVGIAPSNPNFIGYSNGTDVPSGNDDDDIKPIKPSNIVPNPNRLPPMPHHNHAKDVVIGVLSIVVLLFIIFLVLKLCRRKSQHGKDNDRLQSFGINDSISSISKVDEDVITKLDSSHDLSITDAEDEEEYENPVGQ